MNKLPIFVLLCLSLVGTQSRTLRRSWYDDSEEGDSADSLHESSRFRPFAFTTKPWWPPSSEEESSSESTSSSLEDDDTDEGSVENVAGWRPAKRLPTVEIVPIRSRNQQQQQNGCSAGMFMASDKSCRSCSRCGPDLYAREDCWLDKDTVCDWCLNPFPIRNEDFHAKCDNYIKVRREFLETIEGRSMDDRRRNSLLTTDSDGNDDNDQQTLLHISTISISADPNYWWKLEMLLEVCFYLALITLIFSVIRFLARTKPYYRTVHVTPPVLDESDHKNIIHAVESIQGKLGKKGYEKLEEFI